MKRFGITRLERTYIPCSEMYDMNQLATVPVTMTSLEISEMTGKRHDHVLRDIRNILNSIENSSPQNWGLENCSADTYLDERNRPREMYRLDKKFTLVLITGYSIPLRVAVVNRLEELEARASLNDFSIGRMSISELELLIENRLNQVIAERGLTNQRVIAAPVENQDDLFNPSQLGFLSRLSSQRMNRILLDLNFQTRDEFGYTTTRQAEGLYEEVSRRRNRAGRMVVKFLWKRRVLQSIPARYLA